MHLAYVESALHKILGQPPDQRTLTIGGRINLQLVSGFTGVDSTQQEIMVFVCARVIEFKRVKLETSCTLILPSNVSFI